MNTAHPSPFPPAKHPLVGADFSQIDTPSLLLDFDALQANIHKLATYFQGKHCRLRPHFKSHKCTRIAQSQMAAGAVGITCAKLGEAEVLADAGISNILIANQIIGPLKIKRLIELCRRALPMVAVDAAENVTMLSAHAHAAGVTLGVLVEVDVGMKRCGVPPGEAALTLAKIIQASPGLKFIGLQGYEGHCVDVRDEQERTEKTLTALKSLVATRRLLEQAGVPVKIVTGGGTGTYTINANHDGIDEVQAGSYAAMDWWYGEIRPEFRQAMSILTQVISRPQPHLATIDVGRKGVGAEWGPPQVKNLPGARIASYSSEEHLTIQLPERQTAKLGERVEIIPSHGCTTSNLYREFIIHRGGIVVDVWPIEGSGKLQ
jgi:D-serine deaminase-like pyridoxal phosphate-dependent protein